MSSFSHRRQNVSILSMIKAAQHGPNSCNTVNHTHLNTVQVPAPVTAVEMLDRKYGAERMTDATTSNTSVGRKAAIPLPSTPKNWDERRKPTVLNVNDVVDRVHMDLLYDTKLGPKYEGYLGPAWDEESSEGATFVDDVRAADMLRDRAVQTRQPIVDAKYPIAAIIRSLNVVLRRYKMSRKERRYTIAGELMAPPNGNGE